MNKSIKVSFNSPVILGFVIACFIAMVLGQLTGGHSTKSFFCVYRSSPTDLLTYVRLFGHVLGHASWSHLLGNMMLILVVGPLLEEKYGSDNILFVILSTALVTALIHLLVYSKVCLMGASGVVFAFIMLSSLTCLKDGEIPLTFILVALLYIGQQAYDGMVFAGGRLIRNSTSYYGSYYISNLTHIVGGIVGSIIGFLLNKNKMAKS
ncbi:rhomboid family intramembrane serine protease [bacterium]|nr:rhomboid family intramembrane serine protease [bacterium]